MSQTSKSPQLASPTPRKRYSALSTLTKALVATATVVGIAGAVSSYFSGNSFWATRVSGDSISDTAKEQRRHAFEAVGTLGLSTVLDADIPRAVESMGLSESSKQALLSDLTRVTSVVPSPAAAPSTQTSAPVAAGGTAQVQVPAAPASLTAESDAGRPVASPTRRQAARLAWVTLWDTDAEDGDIVRVDSQGYSRTIVLMKQPVMFAVPVPADGIVKVIGIRDGEGGGITVGLASGASKTILPIMSVGQVLNLNVRVN